MARCPARPVAAQTVAEVADLVLHRPPRLGGVRLVAVDGPSGSGKSVLADRLTAELRGREHTVAVVATDDFATWDRPVQWWPRLEQGVLGPIAAGRQGVYVAMDWSGPSPVPATLPTTVPRCEVLIVEGVSAARAAVADRTSLVIWVELAAAAQRLERAVTRDGESQRANLTRWQRSEAAWFALDRTRTRADALWPPQQ